MIHVLRNDPAFVKELDFVMEQDRKLIGQNMFMNTVIEADDVRTIPGLKSMSEKSVESRKSNASN